MLHLLKINIILTTFVEFESSNSRKLSITRLVCGTQGLELDLKIIFDEISNPILEMQTCDFSM